MSIRKIFKLIEYTLNRKQMPLEVLRRKETANASVSSPNFVDPAITAESEAKRLENEPVVKYEEIFQ